MPTMQILLRNGASSTMLLLFATVSLAWNEQSVQVATATQKILRTHSSHHQIATVQNGVSVIVGGLVSGCQSLYLYPDQDPWTYSTLVAAISKNVTFTIAYDVDQKSPWDGKACAITSVSYNQ